MTNLVPIGKGCFTRCFLLTDDTVLLESYDPIKQLMADGKFPKSPFFPSVAHYPKKSKIGGKLYTMHYYKGRPARSTRKWLKDGLIPEHYELYIELCNLRVEVEAAIRSTRTPDRRKLWNDAFSRISDRGLAKALVAANNCCSTTGGNVMFDVAPKNVAIHEGRLILLDCFYVSNLLMKLRFAKEKPVWEIPYVESTVLETCQTAKVNEMTNKRKKYTLADFKGATYNPRKITLQALRALDKSISEFGDLSGVVINTRTNTIVAGHQRIKTLNAKKTSIHTEPCVDSFGTVAAGHIQVDNEKGGTFNVPLRMVNWDLRKEKLANIAANSHGGEFDNQKLGKLLAELDTHKFDVELTGFTSHEVKNLVRKADKDSGGKYVRTLASPVYKVRGKKPSFKQMYDTTRADAARERIKATGLDIPTKKFLLEAAGRLAEFNFANIAEFYAHSEKPVQELMEDLALVIVDADRAIELGYLTLTKEISGLVKSARAKIDKENAAKKKAQESKTAVKKVKK